MPQLCADREPSFPVQLAPFCAKVLLLAAAARGIGFDGACCCRSVHRGEPFPKALGAPRGAMADMAAGSGRWQIALHDLRF